MSPAASIGRTRNLLIAHYWCARKQHETIQCEGDVGQLRKDLYQEFDRSHGLLRAVPREPRNQIHVQAYTGSSNRTEDVLNRRGIKPLHILVHEALSSRRNRFQPEKHLHTSRCSHPPQQLWCVSSL